MLAVLGFATIALFLALTMTNTVSVLVALVAVPITFAIIGGYWGDLGAFMASGIEAVAPIGILITFAVLYFTLMVDTGLFDPAIRRILRFAGGDPLKIAVGTGALTMLVALDGDGASTFLITTSALLPVYKRVGMSPLVLSGVVCLGAGVMNLVPWGGPTTRAMASLKLEASDIFTPVLPAMIAGMAWVLVAATLIGRKERARVGIVDIDPDAAELPGTGRTRPAVLAFNAVLTVVLIVSLVAEVLPLQVLFIIAFVVALIVNCPSWEAQQAQIQKHGASVALVTTMIFAAGIFTGILTETKMIQEMADSMVSIIPEGIGSGLPGIVAVLSMPMSLLFTPDAYYFGVLPVLGETATSIGVDPAEMARASILGQMTTGFPLSPLTASTFILISLAGVDLGRHQRFIFKWAFATTLVMSAVAILTGAIVL